MIKKDLTGEKIGRLTVLRLSDITQESWDLEDAINLPVMKGGQKYAYRRNN